MQTLQMIKKLALEPSAFRRPWDLLHAGLIDSLESPVDTLLDTAMQEEVISYVRRRSNAFSRGKSRFRGVSGREGRWETRIGRFGGLKNVGCSLARRSIISRVLAK